MIVIVVVMVIVILGVIFVVVIVVVVAIIIDVVTIIVAIKRVKVLTCDEAGTIRNARDKRPKNKGLKTSTTNWITFSSFAYCSILSEIAMFIC